MGKDRIWAAEEMREEIVAHRGPWLGVLQASTFDSVAAGCCCYCGNVQDCEPDARRNHCEGCGRKGVQSALVIAGIM